MQLTALLKSGGKNGKPRTKISLDESKKREQQ